MKASFDTSSDNYRVHFWRNGKDAGRVSCALRSFSDAERWIEFWKSAGSAFEGDDLRIHDLRSVGHIRDSEAA